MTARADSERIVATEGDDRWSTAGDTEHAAGADPGHLSLVGSSAGSRRRKRPELRQHLAKRRPDPQTGAGTVVDTIDISLGALDLTFDENGVLYACNSLGDIHTIDTLTAQATLVGSTGLDLLESIAYDPTADVLFGAALNFPISDQWLLYTIDKNTGAPALVDTMYPNSTSGAGLAFSGGTLLGNELSSGQFFAINKTTADTTIVGSGVSVNSLANVYAPSPVTISVPGDLSTIQAAINVAIAGDTVLVADGTYTGPGNRNLDLLGKDLVLRSENGPASTIIDCENLGRGINVINGETSDAVIDGFTITNGDTTGLGGANGGAGIRIVGSSPTIRNCVVTGCFGGAGGGVLVGGMLSDPLFEKCRIIGNEGSSGGGVRVRFGTVTLVDCEIAGNRASTVGGIYGTGRARVNLDRCTVAGNFGEGITGGFSTFNTGTEVRHTINQTIFRGNCTDSTVSDISITGNPDTLAITCSLLDTALVNVFANLEIDAFTTAADPLFCGAESCSTAPTATGDYSVREFSPALAANNACGLDIGSGDLGCFLSFDVDANNAGAEVTQSGFVRMTEPSMNGNGNAGYSPTATLAGVTVTATGERFRDRGVPPGTQTYPQVVRDFLAGVGPATEITVTIAGLPAGTYSVTSFHHDWAVWSNPHPFDILVDDTNGTGQLLVDDADYFELVDYLGITYLVESNGVDDVVLHVVESGNESVKFNGITISKILATDVANTPTGAPQRDRVLFRPSESVPAEHDHFVPSAAVGRGGSRDLRRGRAGGPSSRSRALHGRRAYDLLGRPGRKRPLGRGRRLLRAHRSRFDSGGAPPDSHALTGATIARSNERGPAETRGLFLWGSTSTSNLYPYASHPVA